MAQRHGGTECLVQRKQSGLLHFWDFGTLGLWQKAKARTRAAARRDEPGRTAGGRGVGDWVRV